LRDAKGRIFDLAQTEAQRGAEKSTGLKVYYETVQPSQGLDAVMVFDVAADANGFSIVAQTRP